MRISDWSSDVCSSDLEREAIGGQAVIEARGGERPVEDRAQFHVARGHVRKQRRRLEQPRAQPHVAIRAAGKIDRPGRVHRQRRRAQRQRALDAAVRSEEHTSELQSLMRISYAVFCLKKKTTKI